jgi:hypothetical protein
MRFCASSGRRIGPPRAGATGNLPDPRFYPALRLAAIAERTSLTHPGASSA